MNPGDVVVTHDGLRGVVTWTNEFCVSGRLSTGYEFGPCLAREWKDTGEPGHIARLYAECRVLLAHARRVHGGSDVWSQKGRKFVIRHVRELRGWIRLYRREEVKP